MPAANTRDCFREFRGQLLVGVLFDAFGTSISGSTNTLIFKDGRGLVLGGNGSFWIESADSVRAAVQARRDSLTQNIDLLREAIDLAEGL